MMIIGTPNHTLSCLFTLLTFASQAQTYWQQEVNYTIDVRLDDVAHVLHANETFVYHNNSPDALDTVWMHLWPNAYRDKHTALCDQLDRMGKLKLHFATDDERGYIDSLDFTAAEQTLVWGYDQKHSDIAWIKLNTSLATGDSISISTPFRVKIPSGKFSRLGHTQQAYYITQWYPKPAVFDADGWHAMPYLTLGEFYSEFGSFDVSITLPRNYVVGATGSLQDPLENAWMNELAERSLSTALAETSSPFPASDTETKTIRFTQSRIHDFAWFADKRFLVRKSKIALPRTGHTVTTWALFTPANALIWQDATSFLNESVLRYSEWVGDYPYDVCTAVDGTISAGGGMEYPMITIIGNCSEREELDNVIAHEVGHNWFYGILGSNERDHAWMDEGMNSFVELRYMRKNYPNSTLELGLPGEKKLFEQVTDPHRTLSELGYRLNARRNLDQPLSLSSDDMTEFNYGTGVYMKTALAFDHLFAYLGEETFDKCMHAYYDEWQFEHPQPKDVREVFERESGKNLGWLFDGLIVADRKVDVKAKQLRGDQLRYKLDSKGLFAFSVTAFNSKDTIGSIWEIGGTQITVHSHYRKVNYEIPTIDRSIQNLTLPWPNADRIVIDANNRTLDIDRRNNELRSHGLFKRWKLPAFEPLYGLEKQDRRTIYYSLAPAWNNHDGWQAGLVLHNTIFPSQRTEWVVAPLFAFGSERVVGAARIEQHLDRLQSNIFRNVTFGVSGRTASTFHDHFANAWYQNVSPYVHFDVKQDPLSKPWQHRIALRSVFLRNTYVAENMDGTEVLRNATDQFYYEVSLRSEDKRKLHPTRLNPKITATDNWLQASVEVEQAWAYNARNKQFRMRAFAGSFLWKSDIGLRNGLEAWGLTWGPEDMLYEHAYLDRGASVNFLSRQFTQQQGAFKTPFLQGGSDTWIAALNAELDLPVPIPIALFASLGSVPVTTITQEGKSTNAEFYYEAGVGFPIIKDAVEVWFPLIVSQRIADEETFRGRDIGDRIRFVLALEKLDPTRILRSMKF
ncbi:MAG: M1 family metallopeptidase [Flavobacteriales bacterium]|nr:M1 family metallopeptidase [Flavobacteriales bacterium]MBK6946480.1 M1 family metallopeptidase [Flavobacteriales bacterium]HQV50776.1 M1 family metallopeptidase [Flavobacteriales bacterium]HQX31786.1 M1 family metallopeptidase [Flavobacteriales bacterium]HQX37432.1 M1 family metallopeptidase [Flavobacteriales bacterium]